MSALPIDDLDDGVVVLIESEALAALLAIVPHMAPGTPLVVRGRRSGVDAVIEGRALLRSVGATPSKSVDGRHAALSAAEVRVLSYLRTHLTLGEIAKALFVSRNTVKSQAIAIYRKLGVSSRSDAVRVSLETNLYDSQVRTLSRS
jgi:DNA-binding CsgD family transcriptional regulator